MLSLCFLSNLIRNNLMLNNKIYPPMINDLLSFLCVKFSTNKIRLILAD